MSKERWIQEIELDGEKFQMECVRRPFREGIEIRIHTRSGVVSFAELGLGHSALIEKALCLLKQLRKTDK